MAIRVFHGPARVQWLAPVALLAVAACSSKDGSGAKDADSGTPSDSGGATSAGGAMSNGGSSAGGASGDGGAPATGGVRAGGATGSGGARSTGGSGSGGTSNGGTSNGGKTGSGGTTGTGGATNTGGMPSTGDTSGTGGVMAVAEVRVVGRTDGDAKSPRFEWSSVSMQARFKGTQVTADLDAGDNNYFEVVVDGQTKPRIVGQSGRKKVPLVSGLPDAEHEIVLWRRTEADNYAPSQFFGFDFGGGTLLPITAPPHKLEIIGDSLTCGYGNEGAGPDCHFSFDTENSYQAYGAVAARELDADLYTEAWSGKGMYRNGDGNMDETMPILFKRTIPTDTSSTWGFKWIPDAVVINLATNDFAKGDPGQPFVTAYNGFVADLRKSYPSAYIFVIDGPAMSGDSLKTAQGYLDQVVKVRHDMGDMRIKQILIDPQDQGKNGIGCDYHPSIATDQIMGKALAASIKTTMGW